MDPNTAMDAVTESAKAITKFQEILQKVFGPLWTRKQADADAYADEKKLQTIRDNPDMEIIYTNGLMDARQRTPEELTYRAEQRLSTEYIRQEYNIERVIDIAYENLQSAKDVSEEPIDEDWITRFFNIARDINTKDMQLIWGKILSGEIKKPGSFSLRTLDVVRNISASEAGSFLEIMPFIIYFGDSSFISMEKELAKKYELGIGKLIKLDSCGLVQVIPLTEISFPIEPNDTNKYLFHKEIMLMINNRGTNTIDFTIDDIFLLTEAGTDLFSLLEVKCNKDYFEDWANDTIKKNQNECLTATLHNRSGETEPKEYSATPYKTINC